MNQQCMKQLFLLGHNQTIIIDKINVMRADESLFIHLGNRFAAAGKRSPKHIFLDENHIVIVSEDLVHTYGVFVLEETLTLIDEQGQFCKFRDYPAGLLLGCDIVRPAFNVIESQSELVS